MRGTVRRWTPTKCPAILYQDLTDWYIEDKTFRPRKDAEKALTDSQLQSLAENRVAVRGQNNGPRDGHSTGRHSHLQVMASKGEEDSLDPYFTDETGQQHKNDFRRLTREQLNQTSCIRPKEIVIRSCTPDNQPKEFDAWTSLLFGSVSRA